MKKQLLIIAILIICVSNQTLDGGCTGGLYKNNLSNILTCIPQYIIDQSSNCWKYDTTIPTIPVCGACNPAFEASNLVNLVNSRKGCAQFLVPGADTYKPTTPTLLVDAQGSRILTSNSCIGDSQYNALAIVKNSVFDTTGTACRKPDYNVQIWKLDNGVYKVYQCGNPTRTKITLVNPSDETCIDLTSQYYDVQCLTYKLNAQNTPICQSCLSTGGYQLKQITNFVGAFHCLDVTQAIRNCNKYSYSLNNSTYSCVQFQLIDYTKQIDWPGLCKTGTKQSPIDIIPSSFLLCPSTANQFYQTISNLTYYSNITSQIRYSYLYLNNSVVNFVKSGVAYKYLSNGFTMHYPSQHTIRGKKLDLELQISHKRKDDPTKIVITSFLFKIAQNAKSDVAEGAVNFNSQSNDSYSPGSLPSSYQLAFPFDLTNTMVYHYEGSFTNPPCQQTVDWFVYTTYFPISQKNFLNIKEAINNNTQNTRDTKTVGTRLIETIGGICNKIYF